MEHLKYCIKEILAIKKLLEIKNSNFFKRNLARFIAIRVDDFIKIAFSLNKTTLNQQNIKDELNTLQDYYKEYFKIQRDKFGAHFQELEFSERLEYWSQIDIEKSDFFISILLDIYNMFSSLADFQSINEISQTLPDTLTEKIRKLNDDLDIEKYPNFSSDILSLTRYNSGGLIPCSKLQVKASVLKSIEIIIDYNIELYKIIKNESDISNVIKKIITIDIVSYSDNFITRTDLSEGAKQKEDGLDNIIKDEEFPTAKKIINEFLENYKFSENIDKIRNIRNKSCGHIDKNIPVSELITDIEAMEIDEIQDFYQTIKRTFKKISQEELVFQPFRLEPKDRAYGIQKLVGLPVKPFDTNLTPQTEFIPPDINDINNYKNYFNLYKNNNTREEARHYFWQCFSQSDLIEKIQLTFKGRDVVKNNYIEYRKAHQYFHNLLADEKNDIQTKIMIIDLFIECKTGYPNTLLYILKETYAVNKKDTNLNLQYLFAIGELSSEEDENIFKILKSNLDKNNFYSFYHSLLSIYKIDIKSRHNFTSKVNTNQTISSELIKNKISNSNTFYKIVISLAFSSELNFSNDFSFYRKPLKEFYLVYFADIFKKSIKKYLTPIIKNDIDRRKINKIIKLFNLNRYSTLIGILCDFLEKKKHKKEAKQFRAILYEGIVKYAYNDNMELSNFGINCYKMDNFELSIKITESIVYSNPSDTEYYFFLLTLYLQDNKYESKFLKTKKYILNNFKLKSNIRKKFEELDYQSTKR